jgi:hypothetical protein
MVVKRGAARGAGPIEENKHGSFCWEGVGQDRKTSVVAIQEAMTA